jgi:hypothetical protein
MGRAAAVALGLLFAASGWAQQAPIEATTAAGDKVRLHPDGRWEYADPVKAEPQKKARAEEEDRERNAQGGWFGIGRKVYPGDKDYNRGTMNPNRR